MHCLAVLIELTSASARIVFCVVVGSDDGFRILVIQVIANSGFERISWT